MILPICHLLRRNSLINLSMRYLLRSTVRTRIVVCDIFLWTATPARMMKWRISSNRQLAGENSMTVSTPFSRSKTRGFESKPHQKSTFTTGLLSSIPLFSGFFSISVVVSDSISSRTASGHTDVGRIDSIVSPKIAEKPVLHSISSLPKSTRYDYEPQ